MNTPPKPTPPPAVVAAYLRLLEGHAADWAARQAKARDAGR